MAYLNIASGLDRGEPASDNLARDEIATLVKARKLVCLCYLR